MHFPLLCIYVNYSGCNCICYYSHDFSYVMATIDDFLKTDVRVGKIVDVQDFPEARKPAYKLFIDFGSEIGIKKSSAQITARYTRAQLLGKHVLGVVNLPPRQVGPFLSESLTLGVADAEGEVILIEPDREVPLGVRMF